jgi:TonB-linked SusC/RagA family outer membrane protein
VKACKKLQVFRVIILLNKKPPKCMKNKQRLVAPILFAMRITIAQIAISLVFASSLYAKEASSQDVLQKTFTLTAKNISLGKLIAEVQNQTKVSFSFSPNAINTEQLISYSVKDEKIVRFLDNTLRKLNIAYQIVDNVIVLYPKGKSTFLPPNSTLETQTELLNKMISGTVINDQGEPMQGVTVTEKGTSNIAVTDKNGQFRISVEDNDAVLQFSYVGYETRELAVGTNIIMNVSMKATVMAMDQVVVVGYGTQKKKDLTSSIGTINGSAIANQSSENAISAIQGRLAGVQITNNGSPGSAPSVRIRGTGSIYNSSPLYVVDGIIVNDISYLGPNDIAEISVLRDASASAIYGVQAANGVILVTTKKGSHDGKVHIFFNSYVGTKRPSHVLKMANSSQWITMYNERMEYNNTPQNKLDPSIFTTSTDWFNEVLGSSVTDYEDLSIQGGNKLSSFNIGLNHLTDNGLINNDNFQKLGLRANYDVTVSKNITAGMSLVMASLKSNPAPGNLLLETYRALPLFAPDSANGIFTNPLNINGFFPNPMSNPSAMLAYNHQWANTINAFANSYVNVKLLKNFELRSTFGFNPTYSNGITFQPKYHVSSNQQNAFNNLRKTNTTNTVLSWDNIVTYSKSFNNLHHLKVMAGYTYREFSSNYLSGFANNLVDLPDINSSFLFLTIGNASNTSTIVATDGGSKVVQVGYLGRVNYDYKNKYLLNVTMRSDASSKFPANNRWGYFPSVGLGWVLTQEEFMKNISSVDFLKFRAGWGLLGNANIPSSLYQPTISGGTSVIFGPEQNTGTGPISPSYNISSSFNPNLKWEVVEETNIGFDLNSFSNKLSISMDWYHRLTKDAIFATTALGSSGLNSSGVWGNFANILNSGVEVTAGWKDNIGKLGYELNVNSSWNKNTVTSISAAGASYYDAGDGANNIIPITRTKIGQPVGEFYGYKAIGIFQNQDQIDKYPHLQNTIPGELIFQDVNNDGVIDAKDRVSLGSPTPSFTYGFGLGLNYKNIDFVLFSQGVSGNKIFNENRLLMYTTQNFDESFYKNRWHGEGTSVTYPSVLINPGDPRTPSSYYIESGNYFRIKNIQVGYTLPVNGKSALHIEKLRLYLNAENPFTFFKYNGFSPEVASNNPLLSGVNNGVYPLSSIYSVGLNLNF